MGAPMGLVGVGMKSFDTDASFDDREIDTATAIIKQAFTVQMTSERLESILGSENCAKSRTGPAQPSKTSQNPVKHFAHICLVRS